MLEPALTGPLTPPVPLRVSRIRVADTGLNSPAFSEFEVET